MGRATACAPAALGEPQSFERQDLFSAWRLFFERLSDIAPVALVFEDLQWADASLLDFIEHLLDWSRAIRSSSSR